MWTANNRKTPCHYHCPLQQHTRNYPAKPLHGTLQCYIMFYEQQEIVTLFLIITINSHVSLCTLQTPETICMGFSTGHLYFL